MGYLHVEIIKSQSPKRGKNICGDVVKVYRDKNASTIILADGLGSGITANIYAETFASRLMELVKSGFTFRDAFSRVIKTIESGRMNGMPYAAISAARILNDGTASILVYDAPEPLFVSSRYTSALQYRTISAGKGIILETGCFLKPGEGLFLCSDGITQSGLGMGFTNGWSTEGLNSYLKTQLNAGTPVSHLPDLVKHRAFLNWKNDNRDDLTCLLLKAVKGRVVNILTGPPTDPDKDAEIVNSFFNREGLKIICGGSTAKIAARELRRELEMEEYSPTSIAPPEYSLEGADLVTEGAVTLTQVYNVWDEDPAKLEKSSPVTELYSLLSVADRVNFVIGQAENPAKKDIAFTQKGILDRKVIIPLLTEKLQKEGKLVVTEYV